MRNKEKQDAVAAEELLNSLPAKQIIQLLMYPVWRTDSFATESDIDTGQQ